MNSRQSRTTEKNVRFSSKTDVFFDCDSLRAMWLHTRQDIRQFDKHSEKNQKDNHLTQTIHKFFIINEDGKKWSFSGQYS